MWATINIIAQHIDHRIDWKRTGATNILVFVGLDLGSTLEWNIRFMSHASWLETIGYSYELPISIEHIHSIDNSPVYLGNAFIFLAWARTPNASFCRRKIPAFIHRLKSYTFRIRIAMTINLANKTCDSAVASGMCTNMLNSCLVIVVVRRIPLMRGCRGRGSGEIQRKSFSGSTNSGFGPGSKWVGEVNSATTTIKIKTIFIVWMYRNIFVLECNKNRANASL